MTVDLLESDEACRRRGPRSRIAGSRSTSTRTRTRSSRRCSMPGSGGREDLAVVGDEDQTIYTFTGATSGYLTGFTVALPGGADRGARQQLPVDAPGAGPCQPRAGGRSRGDGRAGRRGRSRDRPSGWKPTLLAGPAPAIAGFETDEAELTAMTAAIRDLARDGVAHADMAVLVRTNAQLPAIEAGLGSGRDPVPRPRRTVLRPPRGPARVAGGGRAGPAGGAAPRGGDVGGQTDAPARLAEAFERELGVRRADVPEATPRANATRPWSRCWSSPRRSWPRIRAPMSAAFLDEVERRAEAEAGGAISGVELLTYHRAKGLEWEAVFLPALEDGTLPIRQASEPGGARRGAAAALRRNHPGPAPPVAVVGSPADRGHRSRGPAQPVAVPRRARPAAGPDGAGRALGTSASSGSAAKGDRSPLSNALACLADGPRPGRRRRPVHRLPRHHDRGHRRPPTALHPGAPTRAWASGR